MPAPSRRILSVWFPRLGAERLLREAGGDDGRPFAVVEESGSLQTLSSLSAGASAAGLTRGQPLRDARAMCPDLLTRLRNPQKEAAFLTLLRRWAGRYSPWVAETPPESLVLDISGCAHLFGGEAGLMDTLAADCARLGLTHLAGIADTPGAAWGLARYAGRAPEHRRTGDAVDAEAPATRSRAARRHWVKGGAAPRPTADAAPEVRIAAPGQTRQAIAPLPVAALRLDRPVLDQLARLGLRRIGDLLDQPRAPLARRFGRQLALRLDQALGHAPEPVSPARADRPDAVRMTLPEPIGLESDILAGLDRLLTRLCATLETKAMGIRTVRLQIFRTDGTMQWIEAGVARPSHQPDRIRPLLAMKVPELDAGFGIDMLRLEAVQTETVHRTQSRGHLDAAEAVTARARGDHALDDLITRIGARTGMEAITRLHPASSHIPEKAALTLAAAWSDPAGPWPQPPVARPLLLWRPEPVQAPDSPGPPAAFRWRRRDLIAVAATGPERIAPEWWLDDPDWRTGVRDYWRVTVEGGERLWLYYAHGAALSPGWFCQGRFP
ncbi:DNA methylase [Oceanicola sp. 22II-s10i]|uniref:Y-family DNA polymerase n=1 Tax=Oceanicola sp. 22II-s10i TaxID=1317116 RepID=UPI000B520294|nr:DNA polymerase Y family protein [Oceanicola sp. 22II-s10i]OWU86262.1 DNA methylase [Oceanicola sp. 22II-s10i]